MSEKAIDYFLNQDKNCAESVLLAANDTLGLNVSPDTVRALGIFGGGMGCGDVCGAVASGVGVLGMLLIKERAHASPESKEAAAAFVKQFLERYQTVHCADLKPIYAPPGQRCTELVIAASDMLEAACRNLERPV